MTDNSTNDRKRSRPPMSRPDLRDSELASRLQAQVNDLVERVTGMRQVKRQYLTLGLTVGVMVGLVLGVLIGMLMNAVTEESSQ